MQPCDFDVLVIGGGPGGSTAAALARQRRLRVLVVEKERFPRFHIGESLLPEGNAILRETGVWPKLESAGFVSKYGAAFFSSDGRASTEIIFSQGLVPGLDYAFQVERSRFDSILIDHARELGAEVRMQTTARAAGFAGGLHQVGLESAAGTENVTARWVVDAGGRDNLFEPGRKRILEASPFSNRVAIYSHFRGVTRPSGPAGGHTVAIRLDNGWFWLIPLDAERTSVGFVTTVEAMRASALRPEKLFARAVAGSSKISQLLSGAEPGMGFQVTSDYSYFRKNLAQGRVIRVGDAAGFFDPIFSSGVYMSMLCAKLAVELVARAHAADRDLTAAECRRYTTAVKRHAGVFRKLIHIFYQDDGFAVFVCPQVPWRIKEAICSIVAGHAGLSWPLWWRFRAFLAVCWLQRRGFRICPALDFGMSSPAASAPLFSRP